MTKKWKVLVKAYLNNSEELMMVQVEPVGYGV